MNTLLPIACAAVLGAAIPARAADQQTQTPPAATTAAPADATPPAQPTDAQGAAAGTPPAGKQTMSGRRGARGQGKPAPAADGKALPQVTVSGSRANDTEQRRMSTAAKMIFGREELDRAGDSTLGEVLKRLPGVTMGGRPGRGGEIRMRGLGSGYTQILVNGERPPPGFSFDSLSPDQVERIEVMRAPVAEHSTQAIAGTINIVLREGYQQKDVQLKLSDQVEQGHHGPNVTVAVPGKAGDLTWVLNASLFSNRRHDASETETRNGRVADGTTTLDQVSQDQSDGRSRGLHLTPRLSWKFANGDTLNVQPFLMTNRSDSHNQSTLDVLIRDAASEPAPEYDHLLGDSESSSTFLRGFGNWVHKMDGGAKLDVKFGGGTGHSDSTTNRNEYTAGVLTNHLYDSNSTRDKGLNTGGKYTSPLGQGHLLAAGWDAEAHHREQTTVSLNNGREQFAESGDNLTADTRRFAAFVQDEWDVTKQFSTYLGLRWEGIRTHSARGSYEIKNTSSVWSPVLHGVYRIPGHEKDQVRASVTRSYKAPNLNDLVAAPSFSTQNSAVRPDRVGNPNLKPELATGLDLAYEHYLGRTGLVSASGFVRKIDGLIRRTITQQDLGNGLRWVSTPTNIGDATTSGIELEAKFQLVELYPDAPNIDFRSNYSRFWSHVDGIPGPDNRLDGQARATANVGLDYRFKGLPLTLGGNYNWTPAVTVRTDVNQITMTSQKRQVDLYGLWRFGGGMQLRVSASNVDPNDYLSGRIVTTNGLAQMANTTARTYTVLGVRFEMKI